MSQISGTDDGAGAGDFSDFNLPDEILAVIPMDPYDQLDIARKITSMAIASRVSNLESETSRLKQRLYDQDRLILELEQKSLHLQQTCQDADSRLIILVDENMKLVEERDALTATVNKLGRDLGKLETFKRQLMQSLSEDSGTGTHGYVRHHPYDGSSEARHMSDEALTQSGQRFPYQITPRLTPFATPKKVSANGSPRAYSAVGTPLRNSGSSTPTGSEYDGHTLLSSWYPSSQQSSAANSPPRVRALPGRPPRIDAKELFRQARSRLSYEQFSAFLANVKELNAQNQSREETLRKADDICGTDNKDLYLSFQGLLTRNVH